MGIDSEREWEVEEKLCVRWSLGVSPFRRNNSGLGTGYMWVKGL